jgi:hypothetical protein
MKPAVVPPPPPPPALVSGRARVRRRIIRDEIGSFIEMGVVEVHVGWGYLFGLSCCVRGLVWVLRFLRALIFGGDKRYASWLVLSPKPGKRWKSPMAGTG